MSKAHLKVKEHQNKNVESSSKFKGHRHLSWATNDQRRFDRKVYQEHPTPKISHINAYP